MTRFAYSYLCLVIPAAAACGAEQIPEREPATALVEVVDVPEQEGADPAADPVADPDAGLSPLEPAEKLGSFDLTYYWVAAQKRRRKQVSIFTRSCKRIARVSRSFARRAALEGSGRLLDGRVITAAGRCKCGRSPCFRVTRKVDWGIGVDDRPLSPFRSVAVDRSEIEIGQTLYVPELDGMTMPGDDGYGGFVHDGCVIADDKGGGVKGRQIDFFTATKGHYRALFERHGIDRVTVFDGGERCRFLADPNAPAPKRGSVSAI